MKLRVKLTIAFLFISVTSAAAVGGIAYWLLMRDFRQSVLEQAFQNFQEDVQQYIRLYGSWEQGVRREPFARFSNRIHAARPNNIPMPSVADGPMPRRARPPFMFLLLSPQGAVIKPGVGYNLGDTVPASLMKQSLPIYVNGHVRAIAVPLGEPNLSSQDRQYLSAMRKALLTGFLIAGSLAVLFGLWLSRRAVASLDELTRATHAMKLDGELEQQVRIRSNDEIGELAMAFNGMSEKLAEAHRVLHELSIRDPLTQLYNRRHFNEQCEKLYQQAQRFGHPLSVMVGDLDHFKQINDTLSHSVGDEVLRRIGKILLQHNRGSDVVARYGGEEFVIAFAETSLQQAIQHCEALRKAIECHPWEQVHPSLKVTMSMGLSSQLDSGSVEKMLVEADSRLYVAKNDGRNRIEPATVRPAVQA